MSVTLATVADALIEFILSLLRDPAAAAEFEEDPDTALAHAGLGGIGFGDVCAVAPVIADRAGVVPATPQPSPQGPGKHHPDPHPHPHPDPAIREIKNIVTNFTHVDDRDTLVDQSVNQNIWAGGDVTQVFDQEAVIASGDASTAAGRDIVTDHSQDSSTNVTAGGDANIDNVTDVTVVADSHNETTDASTTTDTSTTTTVVDSFDDDSTEVSVTDSYDESATAYAETNVQSDTDAVFDSEETVVVDDGPGDDF